MTHTLIGTLGLVLLCLPGWLLARAARVRLPVVVGFLSGALVLVTLVLLLQLTGRKLNRTLIGLAWIAWNLVAVFLARRLAAKAPASPPASETIQPFAVWPWVIALPVLVAMGYRAFAHPLFGADTHFRWGFLAGEMLLRETLSFYPPVTAEGFEVYAWPDGIPPLVSSIYFALYALADGILPTVTGPVVFVQFILLLAATGALARRLFAPAAGSWAVGLLAVTPLAAWASAMGQETGFTALALVSLLFYLPRNRAEETTAAMVAAGIAAAVGALAREYGWAFVVFGLALGSRRGLSAAGIGKFLGVVAVTAVPWYLRNWILSGNPLYNLPVGGLFPVNEAHLALMAIYQEHFGFLRQLSEWSVTPFFNCAPIMIAAAAGAVKFHPVARPVIVGILIVTALWITSVAYTAAGFMYAMRVLNPGLAIGAALGGAWLAHWASTPRRRAAGIAALALIGIDAGFRMLVLPDRPYHRTPAELLTADQPPPGFRQQRFSGFQEIARHVGHGRLFALGINNVMTQLGVSVVPPWSPDVSFIFDRTLPPATAWQRLRAAGITHVLISKGELNRRYLEASPAFNAATSRELRVVMDVDEFILFAVLDPAAFAPP